MPLDPTTFEVLETVRRDGRTLVAMQSNRTGRAARPAMGTTLVGDDGASFAVVGVGTAPAEAYDAGRVALTLEGEREPLAGEVLRVIA